MSLRRSIRRKLAPLAVLGALLGAARAHDGDPKILDRQPAYMGRGWRNAQRFDASAPTPPAAPTTTGSAASAALVTPSIFARSNVTLFAWLPLTDFGLGVGDTGSSCFGYTSPSGREYALFGHSRGMSIVEITQPGSPVLVTTIAGNNSLWRDVRTYSHYAYVVTENNGGIQVVDLANVDAGLAPLVNTVTTGGSGNTHTLEINTQSGYLYRAGGSGNGLRIYDLNANPASPNFVGQWLDRYVHEAQVVNYPGREIAICCGGLNGGFNDTGIDIVDVTNKSAPVSMLHVTYGSPGYSHQAWLTPDRQFLYQNDETDGLPFTRVFDASTIGTANPSLPLIGQFQNGTSVDHNLYTKGTLLFESNYRSGLRVFDRSSGNATPTLVAWFDTYPADDNQGYNGLWNNYPYFPSGTVIGSDLERGLFVWWVGTPQVGFSFPDGLPPTLHPSGDTLRVHVAEDVPGRLVPGSATLWWNTGGAWSSSALVPTTGGDYQAIFPPVPCGTTVQFYVRGTSTNGIVWTAPELAPEESYEATSGLATLLVANDDTETAASWSTGVFGDTATSGAWARVDPIGTTAQPEDDHTPGTGIYCFATGNGLTGAPVDSADVDGGFTTLRTRRYDLSNRSMPVVTYWRWFSNDQGAAPGTDTFLVDVSNDDGATWTNVETVGPTGPDTHGGWIRHEFRVSDFVAPTANVRLRFVARDLGVDSIVEAAVDDLRILDATCTGSEIFCSGDGTAAPCPCNAVASVGAGCPNSAGSGATLVPSGTASVGNDTLTLSGTHVPLNTPTLAFQGSSAANSGLGVPFGEGLRCAGGTLIRLAVKYAGPAGDVAFPTPGGTTISVRGGATAGATKYYQLWYRDLPGACTGGTFNLSNGVVTVWRP